MPHDAAKWLHDILDAGGFILEHTRALSLEDYLADRGVQSIAERQFITIGEALNRIHKHHPGIAQQVEQYKQIIQFRNIVVHGYDIIDSTITWGIITGKLPRLLDTARRLRDEMQSDSAGGRGVAVACRRHPTEQIFCHFIRGMAAPCHGAWPGQAAWGCPGSNGSAIRR